MRHLVCLIESTEITKNNCGRLIVVNLGKKKRTLLIQYPDLRPRRRDCAFRFRFDCPYAGSDSSSDTSESLLAKWLK